MIDHTTDTPPLTDEQAKLAQSAFDACVRFRLYQRGPVARKSLEGQGIHIWDMLPFVEKQRYYAIALAVKRYVEESDV